MERKNVWNVWSEEQVKAADAFAREYMDFLDNGKTERECVDTLVNLIEKAGYRELNDLVDFFERQICKSLKENNRQLAWSWYDSLSGAYMLAWRLGGVTDSSLTGAPESYTADQAGGTQPEVAAAPESGAAEENLERDSAAFSVADALPAQVADAITPAAGNGGGPSLAISAGELLGTTADPAPTAWPDTLPVYRNRLADGGLDESGMQDTLRGVLQAMGKDPELAGDAALVYNWSQDQIDQADQIAADLLAKFGAGSMLEFWGGMAQLELTLEDGTKLWLNSGTELEYPAVFSRKSRDVRVNSGEVLFDVARDIRRPFNVDTYASRISVLGTRFNVTVDESSKDFSAALLRGSIKVANKLSEGEEYILKANQMVKMRDDHLYVEQIEDPDAVECWTSGLIDVVGVPFVQLMKKFEMAYDVDIIIDRDTVPEIRYTRGKLRVSDGIDHALTMLELVSDFTYEYDRQTNTIVIR